MTVKRKTYLRTIPFSELMLWDVKRYAPGGLRIQEGFVLLKDILKPYSRRLSKEELKKNDWRIISKINFSGELFLREPEEVETYKGQLYEVPASSLIYSKINVRHGCVYHNDSNAVHFGVSSEYPCFQYDDTLVIGEYLHLVLRSNKVKEYLYKRTSGISKARIKVNEFLSIPIPLPTLSEQNELVRRYDRDVNQANRLMKKADEMDIALVPEFADSVGIDIQEDSARGFETLQVIRFKDLSRWSVSHIRKGDMYSFENAVGEVVPIKELLTFFEGGKTPSTSRKDYWDGQICWTSPKDFNGLKILDSQDKITEVAVKNARMKLFPPGTILAVFRSGILRHSFPIAVSEKETAINQDLKAFDVNKDRVHKDYLVYYLHLLQRMVLHKAMKYGVTVESINTEEFLRLPVVLPEKRQQKKIAANMDRAKDDIACLKRKSKSLRVKAVLDFEDKIFDL